MAIKQFNSFNNQQSDRCEKCSGKEIMTKDISVKLVATTKRGNDH